MQGIRIAVLGAGSVGCYLGGCLAAAGAEVALIGRPRLQQEVEAGGLHLTDWRGRDQRVASGDIYFTQDRGILRAADYVLVTVKARDTGEAAKIIAEHGALGSVVVSFQNGVRNGETLREHLTSFTVLQGMVPFNVTARGAGHFHCSVEGDLVLETGDGRESALADWLSLAGLRPRLAREMAPVLWGKLLMNLNNAVNALAGVPLVEELGDRRYRRVLAASIAEARKILRLSGLQPARMAKVGPALMPTLLTLPDAVFRRAASTMLAIDPSVGSSMADDLRLGRKTEVDYLNGEIVKQARALGRRAPVNERLVVLIHQAEWEGKGSPAMSGQEMVDVVLRGR